jgi:hypothetical protein
VVDFLVAEKDKFLLQWEYELIIYLHDQSKNFLLDMKVLDRRLLTPVTCLGSWCRWSCHSRCNWGWALLLAVLPDLFDRRA